MGDSPSAAAAGATPSPPPSPAPPGFLLPPPWRRPLPLLACSLQIRNTRMTEEDDDDSEDYEDSDEEDEDYDPDDVPTADSSARAVPLGGRVAPVSLGAADAAIPGSKGYSVGDASGALVGDDIALSDQHQFPPIGCSQNPVANAPTPQVVPVPKTALNWRSACVSSMPGCDSPQSMEFIVPDVDDGKNIILLSEDDVREAEDRWKNALMGYVLGRRPYFQDLKAWTTRAWNPKCKLEIYSCNTRNPNFCISESLIHPRWNGPPASIFQVPCFLLHFSISEFCITHSSILCSRCGACQHQNPYSNPIHLIILPCINSTA